MTQKRIYATLKDRQRASYLRHREKAIKDARIYYEENKERLKAEAKNRYRKNKDQISLKKKMKRKADPSIERKRTLRRYGLSLDDQSAMLVLQNGLCAICQIPITQGKNLNVDHDHGTSKVRGLLCSSCNVGLGMFKDDTLRLRRAIEYLETVS
jgi:ATP-dependent Lon protease